MTSARIIFTWHTATYFSQAVCPCAHSGQSLVPEEIKREKNNCHEMLSTGGASLDEILKSSLDVTAITALTTQQLLL